MVFDQKLGTVELYGKKNQDLISSKILKMHQYENTIQLWQNVLVLFCKGYCFFRIFRERLEILNANMNS